MKSEIESYLDLYNESEQLFLYKALCTPSNPDAILEGEQMTFEKYSALVRFFGQGSYSPLYWFVSNR